MKNNEMARAFKMIAEGFNILANAYEVEEVVTPVVEEPTKKVEKVELPKTVEKAKEEPTKEVEESKEEVDQDPATFTLEDLEPKSYNEIKALAKELGVKAIGTKKVIIDSILAHLEVEPTPVETTTEDEPVKATEVDIQEIEESNDFEIVEDEDEIEDTDEEVEAEDTTLYDQIVSDLEGYSDEELADILSSVGVSPKGKRQALLAKIVQAIEEGVLEWEEDTTEEVDIQEVEEDESVEEVQGTVARQKAREHEEELIMSSIEKGELSHKEIIKYLKDFNNGKYVSQGEDGDIEEYISIQADLVDDEGNKHELADPYYVGDDVYCCGQKLDEVDKDLYCEVCGTTYEV